MTESNQHAAVAEPKDLLSVLLTDFQRRIEKLEGDQKKGFLKKLMENAGAVALLLGLVLSLHTLYDVLVRKPEADRIASLTQFNAAVSSAAQIRQELLSLVTQTKDPAVQMNITSSATPRIMNAISTARAILPELKDSDVGIPQLIVLISEALFINDPAASDFVKRAVNKKDATPYLRAEAKRFEGKYLFANNDSAGGRRSMQEALKALPETPYYNASRAFVLADWIGLEYLFGDCATVSTNLEQFAGLVKSPSVTPQQKAQLTAGVLTHLAQYQGHRCSMPTNAELIKG